MCGRVRGYQFATPDAFSVASSQGLDGHYIDGVSITHGLPRTHIWTFAASLTSTTSGVGCPCDRNGYEGTVEFLLSLVKIISASREHLDKQFSFQTTLSGMVEVVRVRAHAVCRTVLHTSVKLLPLPLLMILRLDFVGTRKLKTKTRLLKQLR